MLKSDLQEAITLLEEKMSLNNKWLLQFPNSNYRSHVHRDNRELSIQLANKRFNLDQVEKGAPIHGDAFPDETKATLNVQLINKQI